MERVDQALLDALPAHVAVLDAAGRIVAVNEAWRRFGLDNGATPEVIAGVGVDYLGACLEDSAAGIVAVLAGCEDHFTLEYPCHSPARQRWFLFSVRALRGDEVGGAVVAHIDITERVAAENDRQQRRERLARAARLSSVAALSASVIHEIAQPLAAARLYGEAAHVLGRKEPFERLRLLGVVDDIHGQVERAIAIVEGLRKFMRSGEGATEPSLLQAIIREVLSLLGFLARHHAVHLDTELAEAPLWVRIDPLQIEQVLVHLVCNGIEAMAGANSPVRRLSVELAVVDQHACVSVVDTGPGFAPGSPSFQFFDCGPDAAGEKAGMGMGLAVSRAIVEAHGGALWVDPQEVGAALRFRLPLQEGPL